MLYAYNVSQAVKKIGISEFVMTKIYQVYGDEIKFILIKLFYITNRLSLLNKM